MKKTKLIFSLFLLFSIYIALMASESCKETETCSTINCNEGTLNDKTCVCKCPTGYQGMNCEAYNFNEIQTLLDEDIGLLSLLEDGVKPGRFYGKTYGGGSIFYLDTANRKGLVAAIDIAPETTLSKAENYCASLTLNGYSTWHLPDIDQLNLMWENLADSNGDGINNGADDPYNHGDFQRAKYWSSTPVENEMKCLSFIYGSVYFSDSKSQNYTRAIRSFSY